MNDDERDERDERDEERPKEYKGPDFDLIGPTKHLDEREEAAGGEPETASGVEPRRRGPTFTASGTPPQEETPEEGTSEADSTVSEKFEPSIESADLTGPGDSPGDSPARERPPASNLPEYDLLELLYHVLFQPGKAFRAIRRRPPIGLAFLVFVASSLVTNWGTLVQLPQIQEDLSAAFDVDLVGTFAQIGPGLLIFGLITGAVWWLLMSGVFHLVAGFFDGRGTAAALFAAVGFAYLPRILLAPALALNPLFPFDIVGLVSTLVFIWVIVLFYHAIRTVEEIGTGSAIVTLLSPVGLFVALGMAIAVLMAVLVSIGADFLGAPPF